MLAVDRCWCGRAGIEYDTLGTSDVCTKACSGDSSTTCGGYYAFDLYQLDAVEQPAGHLGCYGDSSSDRVFSHKYKSSSMTPEVRCVCVCVSYASKGFASWNNIGPFLKSESNQTKERVEMKGATQWGQPVALAG